MIELITKLLSVAGVAAIEILGGILLGFSLNLPSGLILAASLVGSVVSLIAVCFLGNKLRDWLLNTVLKYRGQSSYRRIGDSMNKYGLPIVALIAPVTAGIPLCAAIVISLGANTKRVFYWLLGSALVWSFGITLVLYLTRGS